jgi:hypothetical protein
VDTENQSLQFVFKCVLVVVFLGLYFGLYLFQSLDKVDRRLPIACRWRFEKVEGAVKLDSLVVVLQKSTSDCRVEWYTCKTLIHV